MPSIAVVGSGAIGLYYGGKLAGAGRDVRFLMRSGYDEARRHGIRIYSREDGELHLPHPQVFPSPAAIGPSDFIIIALKTTANAALRTLLPPLVHSESRLLTLQNGLGNEELLAALHGADRVLGGLCFVCLTRRTAASVDHHGHGSLSLCALSERGHPAAREMAAAFHAGGIDVKVVENLPEERWRKLVWNIPFNGLSVARGGITVDCILADPGLHSECRGLMDEVITAANALGHPIEPAYAEWQIQRTYSMGAYPPSTLVDWRAGCELEVEAIWGEPLRAARQAGAPTPRLQQLYEELKALPGPVSS